MIHVSDLRFQYPKSDFRLEIDDLHIELGSRVAILGPSGSGKTTLLNLISGIVVPEQGSVMVNDRQITQMSDSGRRDFRINQIGAVFQQFELIEYLTVLENIILPFLINSALAIKGDLRGEAARLATQVGLGDKLNRRVNNLSRGEQQRVAICRALLPRPLIILADEPTGNLDPQNKQRILELLFEQCGQYELTLVAVTHDINILEGFDRTIDFEDFFRYRNGKEHGA